MKLRQIYVKIVRKSITNKKTDKMGIFGKKIRWVRTCVQCGFNNPEDATMCNKCRTKFLDSGFFGSSYNSNSYLRWLCNTCGTLNNAGNNTCAGCFKKK
jgi:hypothetical protein